MSAGWGRGEHLRHCPQGILRVRYLLALNKINLYKAGGDNRWS